MDPFAELHKGASNQPIKAVSDKWKLVPSFLRLRGLMKQHIDSFNHFINVEIKQIVRAANTIESDYNPDFKFIFKDIRVGKPVAEEDIESQAKDLMPHECRVRDITYSAPITLGFSFEHL